MLLRVQKKIPCCLFTLQNLFLKNQSAGSWADTLKYIYLKTFCAISLSPFKGKFFAVKFEEILWAIFFLWKKWLKSLAWFDH